MNIISIIEKLNPLFELLATVVIAGTAIFGVRTWKKETIGKRKIELAEELLVTFKNVSEAVNFI